MRSIIFPSDFEKARWRILSCASEKDLPDAATSVKLVFCNYLFKLM
jgi:hypothetical protein